MRILAAAVFILALTTTASAKDIFSDKELKDIQVAEIKEGKAVVRSDGNEKRDVSVGDHIGKGHAKVVEMDKAYIVVETDSTRTRIPLTYGFQRLNSRASACSPATT